MNAHVIRGSLGLAMACAALLSANPAMARTDDHWPRLAPEWNDEARDDRPAGSIQFLSATDRMRLAEVRIKGAILDSGTASLSLTGGRARSQKTEEGQLLSFDHFSIKEAGLAAHADIAPGLALALAGNYSVMKRRPELAWSGGRRLSTKMVSVGLALGSSTSDRIALDYLSVLPGKRQGDARMAELMGGAPPAGTELRLSLSGRGGLSSEHVFEWSLSGASISRRQTDCILLGERLAGTDRRLTFNLRRSF